MSRSRASSAARNSGACRLQVDAGRAGAAAGNRNRGRGRARRGRRATACACAQLRIARSRHRLGRAAARAAQRIAERRRHRHRHQRRRACASRATMPSGIGLAARCNFVACDFAAALARPVRSRRVEPALHRAAATSQRCRRRCATTIPRSRSTAAPTGSMLIAPSRRRRPRLLAPGGHLIVELGAGQEHGRARAVYQGGLGVVDRARRPRRHSARAACATSPQ